MVRGEGGWARLGGTQGRHRGAVKEGCNRKVHPAINKGSRAADQTPPLAAILSAQFSPTPAHHIGLPAAVCAGSLPPPANGTGSSLSVTQNSSSTL
jgi:hypothetical protein